MINEKGLAIGESSTLAKLNQAGVDLSHPDTGKLGSALFSINELIQLAMERCDRVICEIDTIGNISEKFGFYGESFEGARL